MSSPFCFRSFECRHLSFLSPSTKLLLFFSLFSFVFSRLVWCLIQSTSTIKENTDAGADKRSLSNRKSVFQVFVLDQQQCRRTKPWKRRRSWRKNKSKIDPFHNGLVSSLNSLFVLSSFFWLGPHANRKHHSLQFQTSSFPSYQNWIVKWSSPSFRREEINL